MALKDHLRILSYTLRLNFQHTKIGAYGIFNICHYTLLNIYDLTCVYDLNSYVPTDFHLLVSRKKSVC